MTRRRPDGDETWIRLRQWTKGQKAAERLSAQILRVEGYSSIDPSHPLGGRDGLKDIICVKGGEKWVGAAYFPRTQKTKNEIRKKFAGDLEGVISNNVNSFAFITNQELNLSDRGELIKLARNTKISTDLFHLERLSGILDQPACYGIRLEFLEIEMTREEQLAFIAERDSLIGQLASQLERILKQLEDSGGLKNIPIKDIREFKSILDSVAGHDPFSTLFATSMLRRGGHIRDLHVPLAELKEFERILQRIVRVNSTLSALMYPDFITQPAVQDLKVPLSDLKDYESTLDRILIKLREIRIHKLLGPGE